jgi:aminopeptidase N
MLDLEDMRDGRRFSWRADARSAHPLVVGRFTVRERQRDGVRARVLLPPDEGGRADAFLEHVLSAAAFFQRTFGSPGHAAHTLVALPLPRGQRAFTFPGMVVLAAVDVAETAEFPHRILAHEVAHNWWSLAVEFPDPDDRWLAEGLPTYSALLFPEERGGAETLRAEPANSRRIALATREPLPLAQGGRMRGAALHAQSYHQAAWVLHMLRLRLGREAFLAALADFFRDHAGRRASAEALRAALERHEGGDLWAFWRDWVESGRIPSFEVSWRVASRSPCRLAGSVRQRDAGVRVPLRLRARGASSVADTVVSVGPGRTVFDAICPEAPVALEVDPESEVLHAGVRAAEPR